MTPSPRDDGSFRQCDSYRLVIEICAFLPNHGSVMGACYSNDPDWQWRIQRILAHVQTQARPHEAVLHVKLDSWPVCFAWSSGLSTRCGSYSTAASSFVWCGCASEKPGTRTDMKVSSSSFERRQPQARLKKCKLHYPFLKNMLHKQASTQESRILVQQKPFRTRQLCVRLAGLDLNSTCRQLGTGVAFPSVSRVQTPAQGGNLHYHSALDPTSLLST